MSLLRLAAAALAAGVSGNQTIDAANQSDCRRREDSACLKAALEAGHPVDFPRVKLFAEGGGKTHRRRNLPPAL